MFVTNKNPEILIPHYNKKMSIILWNITSFKLKTEKFVVETYEN